MYGYIGYVNMIVKGMHVAIDCTLQRKASAKAKEIINFASW